MGQKQASIFANLSKEEQMIQKNIKKMKQRDLTRMIKSSLEAYRDLWKELQTDSPDSAKVILNLFKLDTETQKCEAFFLKHQTSLEQSPECLFHKGLYNLFILNDEKSANENIFRSKESIKQGLDWRSMPKNLTEDTIISENPNPCAFLTKRSLIL
jgi:hypothetical protein